MKQNEVLNRCEVVEVNSIPTKNVFFSISNSGKVTRSNKQKQLEKIVKSLRNLPVGAFVNVDLSYIADVNYNSKNGALIGGHKANAFIKVNELQNILDFIGLLTTHCYNVINENGICKIYRLDFTKCFKKTFYIRQKNSCVEVVKTITDAVSGKEFEVSAKVKNNTSILTRKEFISSGNSKLFDFYGISIFDFFVDDVEKEENEKKSA